MAKSGKMEHFVAIPSDIEYKAVVAIARIDSELRPAFQINVGSMMSTTNLRNSSMLSLWGRSIDVDQFNIDCKLGIESFMSLTHTTAFYTLEMAAKILILAAGVAWSRTKVIAFFIDSKYFF